MKDNKKILNEIDRIRELMGLISEQENKTVDQMKKDGDIGGMIKLAKTSDSENVKSNPTYSPVMDWWAKKNDDFDKQKSIESLFIWLGGRYSGSEQSSKKFNSVIQNLEILVNNPTNVLSVKNNLNDEQKNTIINDLKAGLQLLKNKQSEGVFIMSPYELVKLFGGENTILNYDPKEFTSVLKEKTPNRSVLIPITSKVANGAFNTKVAQLISKENEPGQKIWSKGMPMDDESKIQILNTIEQKANEAGKKQKRSAAEMIQLATSLYITRKKSTSKVTQTGSEIKTLSGSYPAYTLEPKSEEFKKGLNFFIENGVKISPETTQAINTQVKDAIDAIRGADPITITNISIWGYSSTSKVPTAYPNIGGERTKENNVQLAKDRLNSILTELKTAFKNQGIEVEPKINTEKNVENPNAGPEWGDNEKKDIIRWGTPEKRTQEYEEVYGVFRYARAFFEISYSSTSKPTSESKEVGRYNVIISWTPEDTLKRERIRTSKINSGGTGLFQGTNETCPMFE